MLKCNPTKKTKDLLRNKSTNILTIIHSNLYFPTYSNSLKDIGKYLGSTWSNADLIGIQTLVWRKRWEKTNDVELREALIKYNYEDCVALKTVTDTIYGIFNRDNFKISDNESKNMSNVEEMKFDYDNTSPFFGNFVAVTKDIDVINKCAYFEYQRNKIYFRTNSTIKKSIQRKKKQAIFKYKPNKIIDIKSYRCYSCNSKDIVKDEKNIYKKIFFDLRFLQYGIKRWITTYQTFLYRCQSCKKSFIPKNFMEIYVNNINKSPPKYYMKRERIGFGRNLLSWIIHQNIVNGTPFRHLERNLRDYFGIPIEYYRIFYLKLIASKWYGKTYKTILKKITNGHLIHADETKLKTKDEDGYVWVFTNMEEVIYLYKSSREADFLHDLLKDFNGVLVTDFYAGYDSLKCPQQKCLVHLIRDLNDALLKKSIR